MTLLSFLNTPLMKPSFDLYEDVRAASMIMTLTLYSVASDNQLISLFFY